MKTMTTPAQVRKDFFAMTGYSPLQINGIPMPHDGYTEIVRAAFSEHVDYLLISGQITETLAKQVTL